ncbi:hypothetical protein HYN51_07540 [Limnobaculum parvum]|uniref:Uncharacterized protein n=1 Tax=Limnobaculum parvum TaxID=2172103 RepID=A0A2Y9TXH9_9GAMM|nr:hypothetical protein HYN51_07540 [Limnobaculum parvum]
MGFWVKYIFSNTQFFISSIQHITIDFKLFCCTAFTGYFFVGLLQRVSNMPCDLLVKRDNNLSDIRIIFVIFSGCHIQNIHTGSDKYFSPNLINNDVVSNPDKAGELTNQITDGYS